MEKKITSISILGSTGSIGTQTLEVVRANPSLRVCALAAGRNIELLAQQIREFCPKVAALWEEKDAAALRERVADVDVRICAGMDGLIEAACEEEAQITVAAVVGMIGIRPAMAAIRAGKNIALANKETLVTAGHLIMPLAREMGVTIYPVDSEHSAIFQCMNGEDRGRVEKILLTASGGPFRGMSREQLEKVTLADALKHPNWSMGPKITVDSASLVNKGLEVMEASWLFDVAQERIEVLIQPQSVIHSMVQYQDGAVIAQLGTPDMKLPIQYALFGGERRPLAGSRLDFARIGSLTFEKPDPDTFRGLSLALAAGKAGGIMPTVFNAANEEAVAMFLQNRICFTDIYRIIAHCMNVFPGYPDPELDAILETEADVRREVRNFASSL